MKLHSKLYSKLKSWLRSRSMPRTFWRKISGTCINLKLHSKFSLILAFEVTVPILLFGLLYYTSLNDMVVSDTIRREQNASMQTAPQIDSIISEITSASNRISNYDFYDQLFYSPITQTPQEMAQSCNLKKFANAAAYLLRNPNIQSIKIYLDLPDEYQEFFDSPNAQNFFASAKQIKGTYWHGIFSTGKYKELFCPPFYLGAKERTNCGDYAFIRMTTIYYNGEAHPAYIAVYGNVQSLTNILSSNLTMDNSVSYIINERDSIVASSNEALSGIYWLSYSNIKDSFMSSNNFIKRDILGKTVYAGFYNIKEPGWFMVTILPAAPIMAQSQLILIQIGAIYITILLIALALSNMLARSITSRLSSVIGQMQRARYGVPQALPTPKAHDEVGDLIDTYNYMTRKVNQLMEEQAAAAEDLRIAEFNSLQAQINPHFLYNTMDMINWLAQQGKTPEIIDAVQNLSRFYKLTLSKKNTISTIAQEVQHVSIYTHIQNMRFHDRIDFIVDIPDELDDYHIPKLTLQPVIENAILHGILEKESKEGTIVLTGWMEGHNIILQISDDGIGIREDLLATLLTGEGTNHSRGTNIAVRNTHRRLQLLYGSEYGLRYESTVGKGTTVEILIPAQKSEQTIAAT